MQLRPEQLAGHLQKGLRPLYTVWGDEPLLAQEAGDAIRAAARAAGCAERQVHVAIGQHFDWSGLIGAAQARSLFSARRAAHPVRQARQGGFGGLAALLRDGSG